MLTPFATLPRWPAKTHRYAKKLRGAYVRQQRDNLMAVAYIVLGQAFDRGIREEKGLDNEGLKEVSLYVEALERITDQKAFPNVTWPPVPRLLKSMIVE